jgi:M3 family oligoendopeptidase
MKFSEIEYIQIDFEDIKVKFEELILELKNSKNKQEALNVIKKINELNVEFDTYYSIASIRNSIDTSDELYSKAQEYFDEVSPKFQELSTNYYKVLINLPFKDELKDELGALLFDRIDLSLKTFSPEIIEDVIEVNKLSTEYSKLLASAKIEFDGKILNLSQLGPYSESNDREIRKQATMAKGKWFYDHMDEIDTIYDKMVKIRTRMAKKLGYENYVQLGYDSLGRTDYTPEDVKNYRKQIYETLVPVAQELLSKQAKRINIENPMPYDFNLDFLSGNAKPIGTTLEKIENAKKMYDQLSEETSSFFRYLVDNELMDLETKPNKQGGGYCTFIPKFKMPFIFSDRDFVQKRKLWRNYTTNPRSMLIHSKSYDHDSYPEKEKPVRATIHIMGFYFQEIDAQNTMYSTISRGDFGFPTTFYNKMKEKVGDRSSEQIAEFIKACKAVK